MLLVPPGRMGTGYQVEGPAGVHFDHRSVLVRILGPVVAAAAVALLSFPAVAHREQQPVAVDVVVVVFAVSVAGAGAGAGAASAVDEKTCRGR